jgi:predicted PurR-regulated permease PerM
MTSPRRSSPSLFTLAAIVTTVAALHFAREILLPFALATLISFLLAPLADRIERLGVGRAVSAVAVVGVAFLVLGCLGWLVTSQLVDLSKKLPEYKDSIVTKVRAVTDESSLFSRFTETIEDVQEEISAEEDPPPEEESPPDGEASSTGGEQGEEDGSPAERLTDDSEAADAPPSELAGGAPMSDEFVAWIQRLIGEQRPEPEEAVAVKVVSLPPTPLTQVQTWLGPLVAPLTTAGMVVVLVLFMLLSREDQRNRLIRLFGTNNIHATTEALTDIVARVSKYLRMQFLINAGYGLCVGTGLALIGVPNALMWGVLSFSLRFLPYIGPWISAVMPVAVSFAEFDGWTQPLLVVGLFVVLELLVNNVAEPLLYGSSIGVSGMGVIVAAIFWTWLWGAIGLVMAMPLTVCLVVMARYVPALRFVTVLLGDQQSLKLEERTYQRMLVGDDDELHELTAKYLADASPAELYDHVLIPALRLAEDDRHSGALSEEQEASIQDSARDLIATLAPAPDDATPRVETKAKALCIPLRDEGDKTAAIMLEQLLGAEGIETTVAAVESLTSERVEAVETSQADLVVVSVLPPLPPRDSRLLCRRLRERYPALPIIVGYWDPAAGQESHHRLAAKDDGEIVGTLADAVERARAIASRAPAGNGDAALARQPAQVTA